MNLFSVYLCDILAVCVLSKLSIMQVPVNRNKTDLWKKDIKSSVDFYNEWFLEFAPAAFKKTRADTIDKVKEAFSVTENLTKVLPSVLEKHPEILSMLRMTTCPPIARDRLIGLAGVQKNLVEKMEKNSSLPPRMGTDKLQEQLERIARVIDRLTDTDIVVWKGSGSQGTQKDVNRASVVIADRLCGALSDPIIRNAQEKRQLQAVKNWLTERGYQEIKAGVTRTVEDMTPGTFSFRLNVPAQREDGQSVNIPVDIAVMRRQANEDEYPIIFEAKSAGDFTNTNKRRKEEAVKAAQLRRTYGEAMSFNLFLCGYFDSGYLGYEASEKIDWVWEHRIDDLLKFGI